MVAVGVILNLILLDFEYGSAGVNVTDGVKFVDLEEIFCKEIVIGTDDVTGLVFCNGSKFGVWVEIMFDWFSKIQIFRLFEFQ